MRHVPDGVERSLGRNFDEAGLEILVREDVRVILSLRLNSVQDEVLRVDVGFLRLYGHAPYALGISGHRLVAFCQLGGEAHRLG